MILKKKRNYRGAITNTTEIQKKSQENNMNSYMPNKLDNLEEMDKFLETY